MVDQRIQGYNSNANFSWWEILMKSLDFLKRSRHHRVILLFVALNQILWTIIVCSNCLKFSLFILRLFWLFFNLFKRIFYQYSRFMWQDDLCWIVIYFCYSDGPIKREIRTLEAFFLFHDVGEKGRPSAHVRARISLKSVGCSFPVLTAHSPPWFQITTQGLNIIYKYSIGSLGFLVANFYT